jgi:hypothetical protein
MLRSHFSDDESNRVMRGPENVLVPILDKHGFNIVGDRANDFDSVAWVGIIFWRRKRDAAIKRHHQKNAQRLQNILLSGRCSDMCAFELTRSHRLR